MQRMTRLSDVLSDKNLTNQLILVLAAQARNKRNRLGHSERLELAKMAEAMRSDPRAFDKANRPIYERVVSTAHLLVEVNAIREEARFYPGKWGSAGAIKEWIARFDCGEATRNAFYEGQGSSSRRSIRRTFMADIPWAADPPTAPDEPTTEETTPQPTRRPRHTDRRQLGLLMAD